MPDVTLPAAAPSSSKINAAAYTVVHDHTHTHTHTQYKEKQKVKTEERAKQTEDAKLCLHLLSPVYQPQKEACSISVPTNYKIKLRRERKKEKKKKGKKEGEKTKVTRGT